MHDIKGKMQIIEHQQFERGTESAIFKNVLKNAKLEAKEQYELDDNHCSQNNSIVG